MTSFNRFDVVVVPFPFTDSGKTKRRPALVLSNTHFNDAIGHSVMAMITSAGNAPWPLDVPLQDLDASGLPAPSVVRMKLFTLDHRFIIRRAGTLCAVDQQRVQAAMAGLLS